MHTHITIYYTLEHNAQGLSQEVSKGVLGVPGAPYSLLLPRSVDFDPYGAIIKLRPVVRAVFDDGIIYYYAATKAVCNILPLSDLNFKL